MNIWQGKTLLIIGAARQGLSASRYLAVHGTKVILNDNRPESNFVEHLKKLRELSIECIFGSHPIELLDGIDGVCVSGGVPLDIPIIKLAREKNIPLTNDAQIFLEMVKCKVIGITGSAGKTTTTTLLGEIARSGLSAHQKVWVGGNIGNPLIDYVDEIKENDWVVMELSSFQLEIMHTSPHIAVLLNITPNHLDRHKTMQAYTDAKANILTHQETSDWAVLNREDVGSFQLKEKVVGNLSTFGVEKPEIGVAGTFLDGDMIMSFGGKQSLPIMNRKSLKLIGAHNVKNALAASAAAVIAGFSHKAIAKGISHVNGIPHRLEFVREYKGIRWINDSIATAPERVIAALKSISGPLVLLLGGRDKKLPWTDLAREIHIRKPVILVFGEAGPMIKEKLRRFEDNKPQYKIIPCRDLEDAIFKALSFTTQVDTVLLSPGCTSYDEFFDFEERGNYFKKVIGEFK